METRRKHALRMSRWTAGKHAFACLSIMGLGSIASLLLILARVVGLDLPMSWATVPANVATVMVMLAVGSRFVLVRRFAAVSESELDRLSSFLRGDQSASELLGDNGQAQVLRIAREQGFVSWAQLGKLLPPNSIEWIFVGRGGDALADAQKWREICTEAAQLDADSEQVFRSVPQRRL